VVRIRLRIVAPVIFALAAFACSLALHHMDHPIALLLIVPGYLVQAWLFQAHRALGGVGYALTMITVSALTWTLLLMGLLAATAKLFRRSLISC
jgi:hypothetical protein